MLSDLVADVGVTQLSALVSAAQQVLQAFAREGGGDDGVRVLGVHAHAS